MCETRTLADENEALARKVGALEERITALEVKRNNMTPLQLNRLQEARRIQLERDVEDAARLATEVAEDALDLPLVQVPSPTLPAPSQTLLVAALTLPAPSPTLPAPSLALPAPFPRGEEGLVKEVAPSPTLPPTEVVVKTEATETEKQNDVIFRALGLDGKLSLSVPFRSLSLFLFHDL
jgi:hypothetical protein